MNDTVKNWAATLAALAAVGVGVYGFYHFAESALVLRLAIVVAGLLVGAGLMYLSTPGKDFAQFAREALDEGKKVAWPSQKETVQMTGIVFIFVVTMSLFLFFVDWIIALVVAWLTQRG